MRGLVLALIGVMAVAAGQGARLEAPWLTVYDAAGRPRWEVQLETLVRDDEGWGGHGARIILYHEGMPEAQLSAGRLRTDPLGKEWTLHDGVDGVWSILQLHAERARWRDHLTMWDVDAHADQVFLRAAEARWTPGGPVELLQVHVAVDGWELGFPVGSYRVDDEALVGQDVELRGHGLEIMAAEFRVSAHGGEVTLTDVQLSPTD